MSSSRRLCGAMLNARFKLRSDPSTMFSSLGLFQSVPCPRQSDCTFCPFSHAPNLVLHIQPIATPLTTVSVKRPIELIQTSPSPSEPPKQRLKTVSAPKPVPLHPSVRSLPSSPRLPSHPHSRIDRRTHSQNQCRTVPGPPPCPPGSRSPPPRPRSSPDRPPQAMLKTLYDHFVVLYENILPSNPTLPSEHALRQEDQVYKKSTKLTYRNVPILLPSSVPCLIPILRQS